MRAAGPGRRRRRVAWRAGHPADGRDRHGPDLSGRRRVARRAGRQARRRGRRRRAASRASAARSKIRAPDRVEGAALAALGAVLQGPRAAATRFCADPRNLSPRGGTCDASGPDRGSFFLKSEKARANGPNGRRKGPEAAGRDRRGGAGAGDSGTERERAGGGGRARPPAYRKKGPRSEAGALRRARCGSGTTARGRRGCARAPPGRRPRRPGAPPGPGPSGRRPG